MSGREKVGLPSKSSNSKKDEKNLEEKKERDTNKTRSQVKVHKSVIRAGKTRQDSLSADGDKNLSKNKPKPIVSRRKNSLLSDKTAAIRRTRQTDDLLELNSELIKQSPTIIDKLISKNKSAIKKSQQQQKKIKRMPEKSVKDDCEDADLMSVNEAESVSQASKKMKNKSPVSAYNVKRKKIDAGKLLATTIARKKVKASQACIEKSAKKRLLRSNNLSLRSDKNSLFNLDQKRKLNNGVKIRRKNASNENPVKKRIVKKGALDNAGKAKGKDVNNENKDFDEKDVAGPSNLNNDESVKEKKVQSRSKNDKILQAMNPLARPLKKFPVNSVGFGVSHWKMGLQNSTRGRGRGGRVFRGRGRGRGRGFIHKRMPYLTRSDSPVPLLRNGKRRNCDSADDKIEGVKKRRRNISNEFSKSDLLADDQISCATDSEFSFCDSSSTVTKVESFDIDDIKIKTELLSPERKESCSNKIDSNSNLFDTNREETPDGKKFNSFKLAFNSPPELKAELYASDIIGIENKGCDFNKDLKTTLSDNSFGNTDSCSSVPLDSKVNIKSCRTLSLDSKSDGNFEDSSDCDISGDKSISNVQKLRKKTDISERKKKNHSLWVRRSLRGVQKNTDSDDLTEILKLTDTEESKLDSEPSSDVLCSLRSEDNLKLVDGSQKSNEFDPAIDFSLQLEDSPLKTDKELLKIDNSSCKKCLNEEVENIEPKNLDQNEESKVKLLPCKLTKPDTISVSNDEKPTGNDRLDETFKTSSDLFDSLKEVIVKNNDENKGLPTKGEIIPPSLPLSNSINLTSNIETDKVVEKEEIVPECVSLNNNNNNGDEQPVLKHNDNKQTVVDDEVIILDTSNEIISIEDDDRVVSDKDEEMAGNLDEGSNVDISFFKTKDLLEKEKIDEIIESLEISDELTDKTEVISDSETVKNKPVCSTMTKDILNDSKQIKDNEISETISNNLVTDVIRLSPETEIMHVDEEQPICRKKENSTLTSLLLDDLNSKDNLPDNKNNEHLNDKNNDDNLNFSDQSSTSSSYTSAVTELPTSVDSDALEMGDNLSSNDWSDKHYDLTDNNIDNSLNIENMNNVVSNEEKLNEGKRFVGISFDASSASTIDSNKEIITGGDFQKNEQTNSSVTTIAVSNSDSIVAANESTVSSKPLTNFLNADLKIKETPEERANKESILSALGLQSLHSSCDDKSKKPDSNYTGTLKAVIKLNRAGDKKSGGRKMFFKQYDLNNEKDVGGGGDMLEYRICSEYDPSNENGQVQSLDDGVSYRKSHMKQRTVSLDETSNSSISAFSSSIPIDSQASGDGAKDDKGAPGKQSNLVIPEKSSSFSIHPGRLCSDICSYCFGKFGSLDTPCHLAQLKNAERQQKILANESHLKMDSCLCDGCYRYVDRKANCPQAMQRSKKRRTLPNAVCSVQNCAQPAQHSIRRKWLVKLKKSISKKLDIDMDKNPHLPFPLCNQHYYWVDYFTVCGICKKRLTRNHMYALGAEANELNVALKRDGIPVRLSDKLFLCKLCRYYSSLRLKYKDTSLLNANHKLFLRSYKKKILSYLDIPVSESEGDAEQSLHEDESSTVQELMKSKKRKSKQVGHEVKKRKTLDGKTESCESIENSDEPQMIDYSYLDTLQVKMGSARKVSDSSCENQSDSLGFSSIASLLNPLENRQNSSVYSNESDPKVKVDVKPTRIQVKFGNLNIGKLSNLNIGQDSRAGREKPKPSVNRPPHLPGERELPLTGELKQEDNLGRNGWEKYTLSLQFDKETKRLWNELQRPYGNQSSFLRHLVMLEKYWRSGSLVLGENADPRAVKYNQRAKNRVQAYESVSVRPTNSSTVTSAAPVSIVPVASAVTVTSSLLPTPLMTPSTSSSSASPSPLVSCNSRDIVEIVSPIPPKSTVRDITPSVQILTTPVNAGTPPPPPPPPLLKLDNSSGSVMWQKVQPSSRNPPVFTLQNSQFARPIKVVVSSMSSSSSNKPVPNVISVLTSSANSKTTMSRPIRMTLQQLQSFQKRMNKDIKITPAVNISPVINRLSPHSSSSALSISSTTITASAALAAAKAVTTVTAATSTAISSASNPSASSVDTFIPLICDVRSLAGTNSNWSRGIKTAKGSKVTYYTPILPKLPNALTVRHIVPSGTSVPLNSSVTIEKAPSDDSLTTTTLAPEKPSISVFREDCSDSGV